MEKTVEFYNDVIQYFKLNYLNLGFVLLFVVVGFLTAEFIKNRIKRRISNKSSNPITATFISQIISFALKTIVVLITFYLLGLNSFTNKILAGAGLLAFVIGFALKDIGENFLAGILLAFKSPFRIDDLIEVNNIEGFVKDISIRETLIKTPDGKDVFIPNSIIIKNPLFNYTIDGFLRYEFMIGITYENNPTEAIKLILETVNKVDGVLQGVRMPAIMINELAANTINIRVLFWVDTFKTTNRSVHHSIRSKVMNDVVAALIASGIKLPTPVAGMQNIETSNPLSPNAEINENEIV